MEGIDRHSTADAFSAHDPITSVCGNMECQWRVLIDTQLRMPLVHMIQ